MDPGLATVIGMSIAYLVSMLGMALAAYRWKENQKKDKSSS
ncbi:MAG: hypothetical protein AB8G77_23835 [Rhodothermales bacterium]